jgi:mitochondrial import receptor subunit TOM22
MVKVEIVEEKDQQNPSPYASSDSSRTSSSASISSVSSQISTDESFFDRIAALVDIVPPATRHSLFSKASKASSIIMRGGKIVGNIVWVVTTSALLVGLPLAMSLEDEAKIVAQEKESLAQQQGAEQVILFNSFGLLLSLNYFLRCCRRCHILARTNNQNWCLPDFKYANRKECLALRLYAVDSNYVQVSIFDWALYSNSRILSLPHISRDEPVLIPAE